MVDKPAVTGLSRHFLMWARKPDSVIHEKYRMQAIRSLSPSPIYYTWTAFTTTKSKHQFGPFCIKSFRSIHHVFGVSYTQFIVVDDES